MRWDLVVVGAGPAGCAAALAAHRSRPDARILLLDRSDFPRDKPCGDGIAPHALDLLEGLGVRDVTRGYAPVRRLVIEGPRGAVAAGEMRRPAYVVPREVFDARIHEVAAGTEGITVARRAVRDVVVHRDHVVLDGLVEARCVVGADGANGVMRRAIGLATAPPGHVAVALRGYGPDAGRPVQRIVMDAVAWPAYAWSFPLGDGTGRANVGYGVVLGAGRRKDEQGPTRASLRERMATLVPGSDRASALRAHHLPLASARPRQPDGRVLLAGDAASLVNPFTGEGIYYAALSGVLAGQAGVTAADPGRAYRRRLRARLGRHHRHVRLMAGLGRSSAVADAAIRAASGRGAVFDDLVELGLAGGALTAGVVGGTARALVGR